MRVLLLSWEYPPVIEGGLGRHVRKLSEELVRAGVEMHVLTRGSGQERDHAPQQGGSSAAGGGRHHHEERHGVLVHRVCEPPFPRDTGRFMRWVERMNEHMSARALGLLSRVDFDLIHSHDWLVAVAAEQLTRTSRLPWLCTIHATEYGRHQGSVDQPPQALIHAREQAMARRADRLITCSQYMREHVARVFGVARRKVTVIPNGIDPLEFEEVAPALPTLRARFAAPDELLVLLIGRLAYEKGFHLALDALASVIRRRRGVRFVVAGSGTAEQELKRQAAELGLSNHGTFLGWVGDEMLRALYHASDLCVVPSIYEPFGLVALEAMASGCPCIVADTGGLREVVAGDETVALRFPAGDSEALRLLLERMLSDDEARARLALRAREHVLRFAWREVAQRTLHVYRALIPHAPAVR